MKWFVSFAAIFFGGLCFMDLLNLALTPYPHVHSAEPWHDVIALVFNLGVTLWAVEVLRRGKSS